MAAAAVEVTGSSSCSGSSDTSSTGEEERMRRLFQTCDGDGDGYISRNDLLMVCRQLNMEESVAEIMHQLGADESGKISFHDFTKCRMQLVREIRKEEVDLSDDSCKNKKLRDRITSWPTGSDHSLGALSGARESWEYDSGARDLQSPDPQNHSVMQKFLEFGGKATTQAALQRLLSQSSCLTNNVGGSYLELANTCSLLTPYVRIRNCPEQEKIPIANICCSEQFIIQTEVSAESTVDNKKKSKKKSISSVVYSR